MNNKRTLTSFWIAIWCWPCWPGWQQPRGRTAGGGSQPEGSRRRGSGSGRDPIQGRLTDPNGRPLNDSYGIRASIYDVDTGGTALCTDMRNVRGEQRAVQHADAHCARLRTSTAISSIWGSK